MLETSVGGVEERDIWDVVEMLDAESGMLRGGGLIDRPTAAYTIDCWELHRLKA